MIKLKIIEIKDYNYNLIDTSGNEYNINIEFFDIDKLPKVNDSIYINKKLLKDRVFCFGTFDSSYGRKIEDIDDEEIIVLNIDNELIYLKRLYG